jgi:hypothetical protein
MDIFEQLYPNQILGFQESQHYTDDQWEVYKQEYNLQIKKASTLSPLEFK